MAAGTDKAARLEMRRLGRLRRIARARELEGRDKDAAKAWAESAIVADHHDVELADQERIALRILDGDGQS